MKTVKIGQNWLPNGLLRQILFEFWKKLTRYPRSAYQTAPEKIAGSRTLKQKVKKESPYYRAPFSAALQNKGTSSFLEVSTRWQDQTQRADHLLSFTYTDTVTITPSAPGDSPAHRAASVSVRHPAGRHQQQLRPPAHSGDLSSISARKPGVSCVAAVAEKFHQIRV